MPDLVLPRDRIRSAGPFLSAGTVGIVAGGLMAAVTAPLELDHGSWAAAYLVLVVGVAQILLGTTQAALVTDGRDLGGRGWVELASWNLGSLLVIGGTVAESTWLVGIGSVLLVVALVLFMTSVPGPSRYPRLRLLYRAFAGFLALSVAVGTVLAQRSVSRH